MAGKLLVAILAFMVTLSSIAAPCQSNQDDRSWTMTFNVEPGDLATSGRNTYFILQPGYQLVLADGDEQLVITVLDETRRIGESDTRVVEERETRAGKVVEVSRNFFAISKSSNDVYYFGEDVDIYKRGLVVSHEGAWIAGRNGARPGLMMPGRPILKARYYQEIAPGVAMDRAMIVSLTDRLKTPAGEFTNVLKTAESSPLEPRALEHKYYAPEVGLLQDGHLKLIKYTKK